MNFEQALNVLKGGGKIGRNGRTLVFRRGILDVTDPQDLRQHHVSEEERAADDWEEVPGVGKEITVDDEGQTHVEADSAEATPDVEPHAPE
jgi:hypothetical protein